MSNDNKGAQGSDAGWENTQSNKSFNKNERWEGKSDSEVKANIEDRNKKRAEEEKFINMGKTDKVSTPFTAINIVGNMALDLFNKGSVKTRTFFKDSVLSKKGVTYQGIKMSKSQFENLSLEKQNEVYKDYIGKRMSGETDAYGNVNPNFGKDDNKPVRLTETQIETQSQTEMDKEKEDQVKISEEEYKKRRGLKGSRSMFGNAGGRGYFDPVT
tara:strand:- start:276 stop:917 length:642 start_codon:yes stop_codon:yes gene_type:complete